MRARPTIAITTGDPRGIGPEIVVKALSDPAIRGLATFAVFTSLAELNEQCTVLKLPRLWEADPSIKLIDDASPLRAGRRQPTAEGGRASLHWMEAAIGACKGESSLIAPPEAIVTAPIAKESWHEAGATWPGHTEMLADLFQSPRSGMLFVGPALKVILASIHIPLREVVKRVTPEGVLEKIELGAQACRELGIASPRIAVAGINPHAGENGLFGDEDARLIAPAVKAARAKGLTCDGPLPGDTVFLSAIKGRYDLVVAMYHDQGLIPVKLLDRERAVNVTVGLSWKGRRIVRTSPAHGTAFDIAGRGVANEESMKEAIRLAVRLCGMT